LRNLKLVLWVQAPWLCMIFHIPQASKHIPEDAGSVILLDNLHLGEGSLVTSNTEWGCQDWNDGWTCPHLL